MITVLWWLGQNTITIAVMILFVAAACRLFRNRPAVQHVLWAVVLLKFVTPPIVSWPWSAQHVSQSLRSLVAPETDSVLSTLHERPELAVNAIPNEMDEGGASGDLRRRLKSVLSDLAARETRRVAATAEGEEIARVARGLVIGIWLVGGAICAMRQFRRIAGHALLVRRGTTAPEQLTDEVEAVARQVGLRPPRALIAPGIMSPFVWFLGRLRLVWPETMSSCEEIVRSRGVIAHELAHVRRGDHWVAWLELAAGLVWWWNPLFWFVRRRIRASAEMACDAIALSTCPENRREYAELLLELSASPRTGALAPVLGVSASTPSSFERRLSMILSDRVSCKVSGWGVLTAGFLALVALPGWSLAQQKPPQDGALSSFVDDRPSSGDLLLIASQITQTKAPETTVPSVETASQTETTAAQTQRVESKSEKLYRLLVQPEQPVFPPRQVIDRQQQDTKARVYNLGSPIDTADPLLWVFKGRGRIYFLTADEKGANLSALNKDGRQLWLSRFPAPLPIRSGGVEWTLEEPNDKKQVVVTWARKGERIRFCFHTNSGELLTEDVGPNPKSADPKLPGNRVSTDSQGARLERLEKAVDELRKRLQDPVPLERFEKAVDDLRKRLQDPAPRSNSSTDFGARYFQAVAELQVARSRVARLMEHKEDAVSKAAELDEARSELERAEKLTQLLSDQIKADKDAAEAARTTAEANYTAAQKLLKRGYASQANVDAKKADLEREKARVKQLEYILRVKGKEGTP